MNVVNQTKNGVHVIVRRFQDGSTVEAECSCYGIEFRTHSTDVCPIILARKNNKSFGENNNE
jgi:hypothetical protein